MKWVSDNKQHSYIKLFIHYYQMKNFLSQKSWAKELHWTTPYVKLVGLQAVRASIQRSKADKAWANELHWNLVIYRSWATRSNRIISNFNIKLYASYITYLYIYKQQENSDKLERNIRQQLHIQFHQQRCRLKELLGVWICWIKYYVQLFFIFGKYLFIIKNQKKINAIEIKLNRYSFLRRFTKELFNQTNGGLLYYITVNRWA